MSAFIPCAPSGAAYWVQRTALDGRDYLLTFRWSQREGVWRLDLADLDGVAIVSGLVLVVGVSLLRGVVDTRRPAGELVVIDTSGAQDRDPGFDDLGAPGARFVLAYFTAAELAA